MKEFQKNLQKTQVRAVGKACSESKGVTYSETKKSGEKASKSGSKSITKATTGLQSTIKGQFGKKITTVFDKQKQLLKDF